MILVITCGHCLPSMLILTPCKVAGKPKFDPICVNPCIKLVRSWSSRILLLGRSQLCFGVFYCFWIESFLTPFLDILPITPNILRQININILLSQSQRVLRCSKFWVLTFGECITEVFAHSSPQNHSQEWCPFKVQQDVANTVRQILRNCPDLIISI